MPVANPAAVDESGKLLPVPVRVGQAVDVVAQAGRPKTITGADGARGFAALGLSLVGCYPAGACAC